MPIKDIISVTVSLIQRQVEGQISGLIKLSGTLRSAGFFFSIGKMTLSYAI